MLVKAIEALKSGEVIAYPTEAVFGYGVDPFNETAVAKLWALKKRNPEKGLILIASEWQQIAELTEAISEERLDAILNSWPGPVTWVFPASELAPKWVCAPNNTIALRITNHPIANQLCTAYGGPVVSTSANVEGAPPARTADDIDREAVAAIISGECGSLDKPTPVFDAITDEQFRA